MSKANPKRNRNEIAQTILQQLGGRRFVVMTGARNLVGLSQGLGFKLPSGFARNGINYVRITLDPSDTYTVEFMKIPRGKYEAVPVRSVSGVYDDGLQQLFTSETGLDTNLGKITRNAGAGVYFDFHGSFKDKAAAVAKEQSTPGAFIKETIGRDGKRRYMIMTGPGAEKNRRVMPKKTKSRKPKARRRNLRVYIIERGQGARRNPVAELKGGGKRAAQSLAAFARKLVPGSKFSVREKK